MERDREEGGVRDNLEEKKAHKEEGEGRDIFIGWEVKASELSIQT